MATDVFNFFNDFSEQLGLKIHDLNTDTLNFYLTNTLPDAANTVFGTPAEIAAGNGYTTKGEDAQGVWSETGGTSKLVCTNIVWTASGGAIAQFRYAVLFNETSALDNLIGWIDYGEAVDVADGETFTLDIDDAGGIFTLA